MGVAPNFPPRLMQASSAAHYLGMSESKFRTLGLTPKECGGLRLYDRLDLDHYADSLPARGAQGSEGEWDALFEGESG